MFYLLKVLGAILVTAAISMIFARRLIPKDALNDQAFNRLRNAWLLITAAAFLSRNLALFFVVAGVIMWWSTKEALPTTRFFALLLAIPVYEYAIPGLGVINYLVTVHYIRLLCWIFLIPAWWSLVQNPKSAPFGRYVVDWLILMAGLLQAVLQWPVDSATNVLRTAFYFFSDIYVPYYVMSRMLTTIASIRQTIAGLVMGVMVLSLPAVLEFAKHWLLYDELDSWLGVHMRTPYLIRGETGWLRAFVSTGHSLALGYVCALGVLMALVFKPKEPASPLTPWILGMALLGACFFSSLARGAWISAALGYVVWTMTGPNGIKGVAKFFVLGALSMLSLSLTPFGEKVVEMLPFIGSSDQTNVIYRQQLLEISLMVLQENFWFGSFDFLHHPAMQTLIQGDGIIDMVNTYLGYALSSGVVGLSFFVGAFVFSMGPLAASLFRTRKQSHDAAPAGRALLACLAATMVFIATASVVLSIPWLFWCLIGMAVACTQLLNAPSPGPRK